MNTSLQKTILKWIIGIHLGLVLTAIIIPVFQKLFKPKKKEIITFVSFNEGSIPNPVAEIQPVEVESLPEPKPAPAPKPKPVPKPKPKPKPVVRQNKRVTRTTPKPTPVAPPRKQITASDIQKALGSTGGTIDPNGAYFNTVMQRMYGVWQVPVGAPMGLSALGSITVLANGSVSNRQLIRSSGDTAFDQSVQKALNTVNRLPAPPAELANRPITITFEPQ